MTVFVFRYDMTMSHPPAKKKRLQSGASQKYLSGSRQTTLLETWGKSHSMQSSCSSSLVSVGDKMSESKRRWVLQPYS